MSTEQSSRFVRALLDAQHEHRAVKIYPAGETIPVNSVILGFDYCGQSILLDGISQPHSHRVIQSMKGCPFWLQLRHEESFLRIECLLDTLQFDLLTLNILRYEFTDNQRWQPRIHFDSRKGPDVRLEFTNTLPVDGHIKNLSAQGALIEVFGINLREHYDQQKRLNLSIRFNEMFELPLEAELKQCKFRRDPSCHTSLRLIFERQSSMVTNQIDSFIEAFQLESNAWQSSVTDLLVAIA